MELDKLHVHHKNLILLINITTSSFLKIIISNEKLFKAVVELPGTVIVLYLISRVSRLRILIFGNVLSGSMLLLIILFNDANTIIALAATGIASMAISFPTIYLYSSEVFPTVVRNVGIGAGSICARVGSMVAPFIATMVN